MLIGNHKDEHFNNHDAIYIIVLLAMDVTISISQQVQHILTTARN